MKNIQDAFLNKLRQSKELCSIITVNGFQINEALIVSFDNFVILALTSEGRQMLIYKHAVSSIIPKYPVDLSE